jgi:hypothetical protein
MALKRKILEEDISEFVLKSSRVDEILEEHVLSPSTLFPVVQPYLFHDDRVYDCIEKTYILPQNREHRLQLEIVNVHFFSGETSDSSLSSLFKLVEEIFASGFFCNVECDETLIQSYFDNLIEKNSFRCSSCFFKITRQLTQLVRILHFTENDKYREVFQAFQDCKRKHFHFLSKKTPDKYIVFDYHQLFQYLKPFVLNYIGTCKKLSDFKNIYEIKEIRSDKKFVLAGVAISETVIRLASTVLQNNKEIVMKVVARNGLYLQYASDELRDDTDVVLEALLNHPLALQYASIRFRNDRETVFTASSKDIKSLLYASECLQSNKELIYEIIDASSDVNYFWLPIDFKLDREVIKKILRKKVKENFLYVRDMYVDLPYLLKNDNEILLLSVKLNEACLSFADISKKNDREFALELVKANGLCLKYLCSSVKKSKQLLLEAVKQNGLALPYVPMHLKKKYPEILLEAVAQNGSAFQYVPTEHEDFVTLFFKAVERDATAVKFLTEEHKACKNVAMKAVSLNWKSLEYFCSNIKNDRDVVLTALQKDEEAITWVPRRLINDL